MLLIFTIKVVFHRNDEEERSWTRQRGEHGGHLHQRFTTSTWNWMSLLMSTPYTLFFLLLFRLSSPTSISFPPNQLFLPLHPLMVLPLFSCLPLPQCICFSIKLNQQNQKVFRPSPHKVELGRETQKMKGSGTRFRCRSLNVCVARGEGGLQA